MRVPHPIPYQGSKRNLAAAILRYIPADAARLLEPFAGSAALSLACAQQGRLQCFQLNDINQPLMKLWKEIVDAPGSIADAYERIWNAQQGQERTYYDQIRELFNKTQEPSLFLYLLARCVKASVRYNAKGEFNQGPDNRRLGARPDTMRAHILGASRLLQARTEILSADYTRILAGIEQGDVVYMDPPYQGVSGDRNPRYIGGVARNNFVETLALLNAKNASYILSYDGHTGTRAYGKPLPACLNLTHIRLDAGPSSQATLLGRAENTVESLYLSPALVSRLGNLPAPKHDLQCSLEEAFG